MHYTLTLRYPRKPSDKIFLWCSQPENDVRASDKLHLEIIAKKFLNRQIIVLDFTRDWIFLQPKLCASILLFAVHLTHTWKAAGAMGNNFPFVWEKLFISIGI